MRHSLNQCKTGKCLRAYVSRIFQPGIVHGYAVKHGWSTTTKKKMYLALTYGTLPPGQDDHVVFWVAVKELKLSYYIGETLLFTIYTHYGNLI